MIENLTAHSVESVGCVPLHTELMLFFSVTCIGPQTYRVYMRVWKAEAFTLTTFILIMRGKRE